MKGAQTKMSEEEQLLIAFELGKKHAREWVANPNGKLLAMGRLEFQEYVTGSAQGRIQTTMDALASALQRLSQKQMEHGTRDLIE